jgi:Protein of unknown function (DUF2891)
MKLTFCVTFLLLTMSATAQNTGEFDIEAAQRFASLALACVHKDYPNHLSHTLNSDADAAPPRRLTPPFMAAMTAILGILPSTDTGS